jgi:hypothetical protein
VERHQLRSQPIDLDGEQIDATQRGVHILPACGGQFDGGQRVTTGFGEQPRDRRATLVEQLRVHALPPRPPLLA